MDILKDRYQIIKEIGRGGMGVVYLAKSKAVGNLWAIKKILKKDGDDIDFLAEPNILKKLNHLALPRIIDILEDAEAIYIVEDYIAGESLDKQLRMRRSFDEATVIEWCKQLCKVLIYLHNQTPNPIIYRDMKPSNIIADSDNIVRLIDFGIAREYKTESGSDTSYAGTRGYAAPEQYGTSQTDARTDIYSLGVTMYHLLTGKGPNEPPYEFKPIREWNSNFSEGIEYIVNKCIQNDPNMRYQCVDDLLYDLDNIYLFNGVYRSWKKNRKTKAILQVILLIGFSAMTISGARVMALEKQNHYFGYIEESAALIERNDYSGAIEALDEAILLLPKYPDAYIEKANAMLEQHQAADSLEYLKNAATQCKNLTEEPQYHYVKGMAFYDLKNYEAAIEALQQAVLLDDIQMEYKRDLAICYIKNEEQGKAEAILAELQKQKVSDDILFYVDAQLYAHRGKSVDAAACFEKALAAAMDETVRWKIYIEYAAMYRDMRDHDVNAVEKEISVLQEAIRECKREEDLYLTEMLADAYYAKGDYAAAKEKFSRLLELGYESSYIYRNIAILYQIEGAWESARDILQQAVQKFPQDYENYMQLGLLAAQIEGQKPNAQRNYHQMQAYFEQAASCLPNGENSVELVQLKAIVDECKAKGWL